MMNTSGKRRNNRPGDQTAEDAGLRYQFQITENADAGKQRINAQYNQGRDRRRVRDPVRISWCSLSTKMMIIKMQLRRR
jgi:hypothetical protein